ncbi:MAG: hypothetical protein U0Y10_09050 [Spirosomataceae bacterium]
MTTNRLHYASALVLMVFVTLHLGNHLMSLQSVEAHLEAMEILRQVYRNPFAETLLMLSCLFQVYSGLRLMKQRKGTFNTTFEKIRLYSGLYVAFFLIAHPIAIWVGRLYMHLDTNFYFGAAVLNKSPYPLFYVPYYLLGVVTFFAHLAAVHYTKMQKHSTAAVQSWGIIGIAFLVGIAILYGFTGGFRGLEMPATYQYLP